MVSEAMQHTFKEKELCAFKASESLKDFMIVLEASGLSKII